MSRHPQYYDGQRNAFKWAVEWLHAQAKEMNDSNAKTFWDSAAFQLGLAYKEYLAKVTKEVSE